MQSGLLACTKSKVIVENDANVLTRFRFPVCPALFACPSFIILMREFFAQPNLEAPEESVTLRRIRIHYYLVFCVERILLNHLIRLIDQWTVPKNWQLQKTSHTHHDNSNKLDTDHLLQYQ